MSVVNAYAKALFEAVTEMKATKEQLDRYETSLVAFAGVVESSKELCAVLYGPVASHKEKAAIVDELAKKLELDAIILRFLNLLATKNRLALLKDMHEEFARVRLAAEGGVLGSVVSAEALGAEDVASLVKTFSDKLGKKMKFNVATDPGLLAGMKVTVGGVTYDLTLKNQLEKLRDRFIVSGTGSESRPV